jgi:hypothetical protein
MTARLLLVALACGLAGCTPQPRSASYFQAHTDEATKVVGACAAGTARGEECATAQTGLNAAARDARMAILRKSF